VAEPALPQPREKLLCLVAAVRSEKLLTLVDRDYDGGGECVCCCRRQRQFLELTQKGQETAGMN